MISSNSIFLLALINSFIFGIKSISNIFLFKYKLLIHNQKLENTSNIAVATILGLFIFCIVSNLILLIPSLVFFIDNKFPHFDFLVNFTISTLKFLFIVISFYGLIDFLNLKNLFIKKGILFSTMETNRYLVISLLISSLIYLLASPKSISSGIFYDTGLYHLPLVNHLSKFSIEPGLANLHFRYGFYGLSFFGQVPIQTLTKNTNYLSPSLNIGFFAIYLFYFMAYIKKNKI